MSDIRRIVAMPVYPAAEQLPPAPDAPKRATCGGEDGMIDFSGLQATSAITNEWKYPAADPNCSGRLQVDTTPDHMIYWEEYGNPSGEPVMFLHGGPGGACAPVMARFFDPVRYRVILFDQRGCGKSEPTVAKAGPAVALAHNTTDYLIEDINKT